MSLLTKHKETHRLTEQISDCWPGRDREFRMDQYALLHLKQKTNTDVAYGIWNAAQCYVAAWVGGEFGGEWIHVYV